MIKPIVKDISFLEKPSVPATNKDLQTVKDLKDTLKANRDRCVGMAANMIGVSKRIIIFSAPGGDTVMINPKIAAKQFPYQTEEGCLSLEGTRKTTRYKKITVEYLNDNFRKVSGRFEGYTAQIIQHEIDHLDGIII